MFEKLLIANRGEIAVRILRCCRELSIGTVAVYSDADRGSLHVRLADEARPIGPAPSPSSYLKMDAIIEAAKATGCDAIHPGYGFLAENADFARACEEEGVKFVGPTSAAVRLMGDKARAREVAIAAGVPVVPGTEPLGAELTPEALRSKAQELGFPLLVKATAGGGGKGMRAVRSTEELPQALAQARSEALASFGDDSVFLERLIDRPRHIEIQIVADEAGSHRHLLERECSIQRRHQKLIEEAPSPFVGETLRARMGEAALALSRAAAYTNAGTVEFLVDADGNFYFLEMNARLQVEHPVTESVTGIDLVRLQLEIASGERIGFEQSDVRPRGWAMEFRITAEDPFQNFLPSSGHIDFLRPAGGPGVRDDSGVFSGAEVSPHYDALIAKLIVSARDRNDCIQRARRAVREYRVEGIATTLPFFERILDDRRFVAGEIDVGFIDRHWLSEIASREGGGRSRGLPAALAAAAVSARERLGSRRKLEASATDAGSTWKRVGVMDQLRNRL